MYEKIIDSYSNDSVETIKEEVTDFLARIGENLCLAHSEEIRSREEYKKKEEAWEKLFCMAGGKKDLKAAIRKLDNFISYQVALTEDLFCQYGMSAFLAKKDLKASIPEVIKLYRNGVYRQYIAGLSPESYNNSLSEFKKYRQYIIDKLGEPAANIIDDLSNLEAAAEEPAYIIRYIGAYLDAKLIAESMSVCVLN